MIEILGVTVAWETLAWVGAFVASEVIGASSLKENGVASLVKSLVDQLKPHRTEDEKVAAIKKRLEEVAEELKGLGK